MLELYGEMGMEKGLVTILTPCYNGETFIVNYLESILKQTYSNIELLFIDDGSTDQTAVIIENYRERLEEKCERFLYVKIQHGGQAQAVNYGLKMVNGEFLIWPDSDDFLLPDSIERRVEFLNNNIEFGFVRSNGIFVDFDNLQKIGRISEADNRVNGDIYLDLILEKTYCACGCYMLRTKLLFDIYPQRDIFVSAAGQNWQLLIPYAGRYKCGYIDEDQYVIRVRKDSHSRRNRTIEEDFERLDSLREILEQVIPLARRNEFFYDEILNEKYFRIKFDISYQRQNKKNIKKYFHKLIDMKCVTYKDVVQYCEINHKMIFRIYLLFDKMMKRDRKKKC